jgi:hypothetical protein
MMTGDGAGLLRVEDQTRHLIALNRGGDAILSFVVEEIDHVIGRIIKHGFCDNLHVCPASHNDSVKSHEEMLRRGGKNALFNFRTAPAP